MGMYSYFDEEDMVVKEGCMESIKQLLAVFEETYPDWNKLISRENMVCLRCGEEHLTFGNWTDIKLIGYWYDEVCLFLTLLAKYIEDESFVAWDFESKDEAGEIKFVDGKCKIIKGIMKWTANDSRELCSYQSVIPEEIQKLLILNNLE